MSYQKKPKMVLMGRSNVGKSTLLNHLCEKEFVKVSKTPGSSQKFSIFSLSGHALLIDTPGYGFTKAPISQKNKWTHSWNQYLEHHDPTRVFLLLIDGKVGPKAQDIVSINWLQIGQIPFLLALTKSDRTTRHERDKCKAALESFAIPENQIIPCSKKDPSSWKRLRAAIKRCLLEIRDASN
ncbi:ribosome biogenesis GTP-binding protein YihA/YsxC [Candidatus Similichlamydia epinepheli]|uniref:ribosome biogenesis GTP-binding protein YihA/YsxC n=1 Tax=Candidatus Similichlamydia epinepheli TaxID=1903953 RepID=UPI00130041DD|nr:ribosome biogenesis GTP-binding protein YihA/YsxC [Candidatus Similichlamydia epinepheli]